jgi:hypothetical protein
MAKPNKPAPSVVPTTTSASASAAGDGDIHDTKMADKLADKYLTAEEVELFRIRDHLTTHNIPAKLAKSNNNTHKLVLHVLPKFKTQTLAALSDPNERSLVEFQESMIVSEEVVLD